MGLGEKGYELGERILKKACGIPSVDEFVSVFRSSQPVNGRVNPGMFGGLSRTARLWMHGEEAVNVVEDGMSGVVGGKGLVRGAPGHNETIEMGTKKMGGWDALKRAHQNPDGTYNKTRIAGSYLTAAAAGRAITNDGDPIHDKDGNFDVPGIPYI